MSDYAGTVERDGEGKPVRLTFQRVPDSEYSHSRGIVVCPCGCGREVPPTRKHARIAKAYATDACRARMRNRKLAQALARQASLDFTPAPAPLPPVVDQRVPRQEARPLQRMARLILERLRSGEATASELQAMFPGARSVRTRISNVNRWLQTRGERVTSAPVRGTVGEWIYRIEANT